MFEQMRRAEDEREREKRLTKETTRRTNNTDDDTDDKHTNTPYNQVNSRIGLHTRRARRWVKR